MPDALRQIWPNMGKRYAGLKTSFESASSIKMQLQTENVNIAPDGNTATVIAEFVQEFTPQGKKPQNIKIRDVFQLAKSNGSWIILDVQ